MNKKMFTWILTCIILCMVCINKVYADTVTLYANIDDSSSQCNLLIDAMRSDQAYDPYNQYCVIRAGEFDYRVYFGEDLDADPANLVYYRYVPSTYNTPASLTRGSASKLTINKNGYYYVGNTSGALASAQAESYKLGAVITVSAVVIILLILFKMFRKSEGRRTKYYSVR